METARRRAETELQKRMISEPTKAGTKTRQVHSPHKDTKRDPGLGQGKVQASSTNDNPGEEDGTEGPMIIEAEMGGYFVHRMYVDGGSSLEIL
nr:hypothetical protein [Tanacetum cinerariifolium]